MADAATVFRHAPWEEFGSINCKMKNCSRAYFTGRRLQRLTKRSQSWSQLKEKLAGWTTMCTKMTMDKVTPIPRRMQWSIRWMITELYLKYQRMKTKRVLYAGGENFQWNFNLYSCLSTIKKKKNYTWFYFIYISFLACWIREFKNLNR